MSFGELFGSRWRRGAHAIRSSRLDRIACRPSLNQPQIRTKTASSSKARVQRTKTQNKTTTNAPRPLFPPIWAPNWAPGGGSSKSLFRGFSSFGPSWDPNASKILARSPQNHPGPPFPIFVGHSDLCWGFPSVMGTVSKPQDMLGIPIMSFWSSSWKEGSEGD